MTVSALSEHMQHLIIVPPAAVRALREAIVKVALESRQELARYLDPSSITVLELRYADEPWTYQEISRWTQLSPEAVRHTELRSMRRAAEMLLGPLLPD